MNSWPGVVPRRDEETQTLHNGGSSESVKDVVAMSAGAMGHLACYPGGGRRRDESATMLRDFSGRLSGVGHQARGSG